MLAQTIINHNIIAGDVFAQKDERISNPVIIFEKAMQEVAQIYESLERDYGVSFDEMESFLTNNGSEMVERLNELWEHVDCDIYDKYRNGTLELKSYISWKNCLDEWIKLFESAVRFFVYRQFSRVYEIPSKLTLKAA